MSARHAALALLSALLAWGPEARDASAGVESAGAGVEPPPIHMQVESCRPEWESEIRLTVALELGDQRLADAPRDQGPAGPGSAGADAAAGYTLNIRCDERRVQVVARDSKTAVTLERTLTDVPDATAPRLIALVAVELLTTFNPALRRRLDAPARPSKPSPPPPLPPPPVAPPAPPEDRRMSLTAGWVYRSFLASGGVQAWGGVLDGRRASQSGRWSAGVGVEVAGDGRSTSIGEASALLASLRASAGARIPVAGDRLALSLDLGGRAGIVRLAGHAAVPNVDASTAVRPWAGPVWTMRALFGVSSFCAEIAAEAGWAAVSATGLVNSGEAIAASGPWLAISLGVGSRR